MDAHLSTPVATAADRPTVAPNALHGPPPPYSSERTGQPHQPPAHPTTRQARDAHSRNPTPCRQTAGRPHQKSAPPAQNQDSQSPHATEPPRPPSRPPPPGAQSHARRGKSCPHREGPEPPHRSGREREPPRARHPPWAGQRRKNQPHGVDFLHFWRSRRPSLGAVRGGTANPRRRSVPPSGKPPHRVRSAGRGTKRGHRKAQNLHRMRGGQISAR